MLRRTRGFHFLFVVFVAGLFPVRAALPADVTLETLLDEMVTRDQLARFPAPAYTCKQFSSYDRDTVGRDKPGWFANWDRSQFVRIEENQGRKEHVLMDTDGPGAVVRFWGTWHGPRGGPFSNGTLRVYLDHSETPAIAGPTTNIISGGHIVGPPLSASVSPNTEYARRGHNLYLPIPYARHCKITYETKVEMDRGAKKGEALYYQINYRTYENTTRVQSFSLAQIKDLASKIDRVQSRLMLSGVSGTSPLPSVRFHGPIAPGKSLSIDLTGPAAIRELSVKLHARNIQQALRSTVLEISFDGARTVWCPVGDFFGTGYRSSPYQTWYTRVTPDGTMSSYWVMPFEKACRLAIHNFGDQDVDVDSGGAFTSGWDWNDRSLHFHSTWRQFTRVRTGPNKNMTGVGAFDVNYVQVQGRGTYVGDTLTLFNGTNAWWGEGDEKIFVDGEAFPSHIGTGTEDYYGYAWCKPADFAMPFHAQPDGSGNLKAGFSVNSRYRSLDAIPFETSIRFDMEMWHWRSTQMNYAPATFFYARPGADFNVKPDPESVALKVAQQEDDVVEIFRVKGVIEGESLRIVSKSGGDADVQNVAQFGWSGHKQLWWRHGKPGDTLVLEFPAKKTGRFRVKLNLTRARDYGIVRIAVNGTPAKVVLDRYAQEVKHDLLDLGVFELKQGKNRLEVRIEGANSEAIKSHMFGVDYIKLEASSRS